MMDDKEVQEQLDQIEEAQRIELGKEVSTKPKDAGPTTNAPQPSTNLEMSPPQSAKRNSNNLEDLLQDSDGEGVVMQGAEDSFEFNPSGAMTSQAAATGFDGEFTETIVIDST